MRHEVLSYGLEGTTGTTKRAASKRHRDDPAPQEAKRQKIQYDEESRFTTEAQQGEEICFFWYHGQCSRLHDARFNYQCNSKHGLTDPHTMVLPPPGYIHSKPCGLEWCPGDAPDTRNVVKDDHADLNHSKASLKRQAERNDHSNVCRECGEAKNKESSSGKAQDTQQTCFFWYHGKCKRNKDQRRNSGCPMRHELENPPSMVQPPPGCVHKEPCVLEWCPGDAAKSANGSKRNFRKEKGKSRALNGSSDDCTDETGNLKEMMVTRGADDGEDWYLSGFEDGD